MAHRGTGLPDGVSKLFVSAWAGALHPINTNAVKAMRVAKALDHTVKGMGKAWT
jgi:hypothetical protein